MDIIIMVAIVTNKWLTLEFTCSSQDSSLPYSDGHVYLWPINILEPHPMAERSEA